MIGETSFIAAARLDANGELSVKVTAITPYGDRTTSVTEEVTEEKLVEKIKAALQNAIACVRVDLERRAFGETARAVTAAIDAGERLESQEETVRVENYDELQKQREAEAKSIEKTSGGK